MWYRKADYYTQQCIVHTRITLDAQHSVINHGEVIAANCPRLEGPNVQILELHTDHQLIERKPGFSIVAIKPIESYGNKNPKETVSDTQNKATAQGNQTVNDQRKDQNNPPA